MSNVRSPRDRSLDHRARRRRRGAARLALPALAVAVGLASPAWATFHLARISEVFLGMPGHTDAQYITIAPFADFQNLFSTVEVTVYGADGTQLSNFTVFASNLPSSATNQKSILVSTAAAQNVFGIPADQTATGTLPDSGVICFHKGITFVDCVSYGAYSGPTSVGGSEAGPPAPSPPPGLALRRDFGADGVLAAIDDTDNSAADFDLAVPRSENFAGIRASDLTITAPGGVVTLNWTGTATTATIHKTDDPTTVRTSTAVAAVAGSSYEDLFPDEFPGITYYVVKP